MIFKILLIIGVIYFLYRTKKRNAKREQYLRMREREIRKEVEKEMQKKYKKRS